MEGENPLLVQPWLSKGNEQWQTVACLQKKKKDLFYQHWQPAPTIPPKNLNPFQYFGFTETYMGTFDLNTAKDIKACNQAAADVTYS